MLALFTKRAEPNAFATGWNRNKSLVAVSTGLLQNMNQQELDGVLGHEISHIANDDILTILSTNYLTFTAMAVREALCYKNLFHRYGYIKNLAF